MPRTKIYKSVLLLAGSFVFAFLLAEMVHEFGHYLAHLAYRTPGAGIYLDPFGGSHITGVASIPDEAMLVTTLAGPLSSLVFGIATTTVLWRIRKPILLPLLLWGPVAMVQEGVNFSLGLLSPGSDAAWISALLLPGSVLLLIGLLLLVGGIVTIPLLLPMADIQPDQSVRQQFLILLIGMGTLMLIRFVYSALAVPGAVQENLFPLIFTVLLSAIVVSIHLPITKKVNKGNLHATIQVSNAAIMVAWILGGGLFLFQILALN